MTGSRRRKEWFDNDAFWQDVAPFLFTEARVAQGAAEVDHILSLAAPAGQAVLDLCCGLGRSAVPLATRGYAVTAVDRTKYFLDKAKARARASGVQMELVQADMRDFVRPEAFDLALNLFTSFGYFERPDDEARVLENVYRSLRPGGMFVIDVFGKELLGRVFQPTTSTLLPNGGLLVQRHEIVADWTRVRNSWLVVRKGRAKNYVFEHTIYSGQELRLLLERSGFVSVQLFGNLEGATYDEKASRLVAVARKTSS